MKVYPKYKTSGVEWIGKIPEHWEIWKIKYTSYVKGRIGWDGLRSDEFFENEYAFLVTGTDFINGLVNWKTCYQITKERYIQDRHIQLKEEDLLITKDGTIGKTAVVKELEGFASLNSGVFVVRPLRKYKSDYLYYILNSTVFKQFIDITTTGTTILHLYQNIFEIFEFTVPPVPEQLSIVRFLDYKTGQINRFIANRQKQIEFLKEQKAGIINKAVTKGINSNAKMKPSGIEWIGEIPESWSISKVKFVAKVKGRIGFRGYTVSDLVEEGEGALTLGATHIDKEGGIDLSKPVYIKWEKYYESPEIMVEADDILVVQRGSIGVVGIVKSYIGPATINPSLVVLKKVRMNRYLLFLQLRSKIVKEAIITIFNETAVPMLSQNQISNFNILLPPTLAEQDSITEFIKTETSNIDTLISKYQKQIDLMQEYRTSLISQAITGKIDVREWQPKVKEYKTEDYPLSIAAEK